MRSQCYALFLAVIVHLLLHITVTPCSLRLPEFGYSTDSVKFGNFRPGFYLARLSLKRQAPLRLISSSGFGTLPKFSRIGWRVPYNYS